MAEKKKKRNLRCSRFATALYAFLVGLWSVNGDSLAGEVSSILRKVPPPTSSGFPPTEVLASDIPLYFGDFNFPQFLVKNSTLFWAESSETPIKKMSTNGGEITPLVRRTRGAVNAVARLGYIYWIENGDQPGFGVPDPRLNRTSLDGMITTILDEGPRELGHGTADILLTESDAYWVNTLYDTICTEGTCRSGYQGLLRRVPLNGDSPTTVFTTEIGNVIVSLITDGTSLYWQEDGNGHSSGIKKMPLGGGEVTVLVDRYLNGMTQSWESVGGMAVGGTEVFFASYGQGLMKVPASGGSITTLFLLPPFGSEERRPLKMAADEVNLYWLDSTRLNSIPRSGGNINTLASGLGFPADLVISEGRAIWAEDHCCRLAFTGSVKMVPTSGGTVTTVVSGLDGVRSIDVDSMTVLFVEGSVVPTGWHTGRIAKISIAGGPVTTIVSAVTAGAGSPIAVDDWNVYFADGSGLKKVPIGGGIVETLASDFMTDGVFAMATDGQFIYWLNSWRRPALRKISIDGGWIEDIVPYQASSMYAGARLLLNNGYLYWVWCTPACAITKVTTNGGPVIPLTPGLGALGDLAVDGADLYFTQGSFPETIRKISVNGGSITTLTAVNDGTALAADNGNVYWANFFTVGTVPSGGGTGRWLAANAGAYAFAVDADGIYWLQYGGNIIKIDRSTMDGFVNIFAPRLGEIWTIGRRQIIQWWYGGFKGKVTVALSRDGGTSWTTLFRQKANNGSQLWKVTKPATTEARIRVCSVSSPSVCDTSDLFIIR